MKHIGEIPLFPSEPDKDKAFTPQQVDTLLAFERALNRATAEPNIGPIFHETRTFYYRNLPYEIYLQTAHWQEVRACARKHHGDRCAWCGKGASGDAPLDAHHMTYQRLGEEDMKDLIILCRYCHARWHREEAPRPWRPTKRQGVGGRQWYSGAENRE